ncbi:MAG: cytochrome b/b6 domain-containing protein [Burkholderiales bacterium]|nr:cytochrome b/b6 domain-containing protein [Burkholderiales bacterium]
MNKERILVWDLPTRLFHWLLAATFAGAWLTAESERWRDVHVALGYTFAGLIAFRLAWGFIGSRHARFSSFVTGPGPVKRYLASLLLFRPEHHVGHNPAGGWAVLALLGLGLATAASGYAVHAEFAGHWLEELHEGVAEAMLALVFVHIGAVVVSSLIHRENLARAMWTGFKRGSSADAIRRKRWVAAGALLALVAGIWTAALQGALR